jgi:hypothetical protein
MGKSSNDGAYYLFGLRLIGDFGATIAIPVVVLSWVGRRLDERWGTKPWLVLCSFTLAALLSGYVIYRKARTYEKAFKELDSAPKKTYDDPAHRG